MLRLTAWLAVVGFSTTVAAQDAGAGQWRDGGAYTDAGAPSRAADAAAGQADASLLDGGTLPTSPDVEVPGEAPTGPESENGPPLPNVEAAQPSEAAVPPSPTQASDSATASPTVEKEPGKVHVAVDLCVPVQRPALQRMLHLELGPRIAMVANSPVGSAAVVVTCKADEVEMALVRKNGEQVAQRTMAMAALGQAAGARLLALTIAELVVSTWLEQNLVADSTPESPPPSPEESALSRAAQVQIRRRMSTVPQAPVPPSPPASTAEPANPGNRLALGFGAMHWSGRAGPTWLGARLQGSRQLISQLTLELGAEFWLGQQDNTYGTIHTRFVGGRVLLQLQPWSESSAGHLSVGLGALVGRVQVGADRSSEEVGFQAHSWFAAGPLAQVRVFTANWAPLVLGLSMELGWLLPSTRILGADRRQAIDFSVPWVGAALDLGLLF